MTDDEFMKQYGVDTSAKSAPLPEDDFMKKYGAEPNDGAMEAIKKGSKNVAGGIDAIGDFIYGIPKFGAQGALAVASRGLGILTGNKATLNDTWDAAGKMIDEAAPGFGKMDHVDELPGYTYPNYPLQKIGEGINYVGDKAGEITGSGDVAGGVKLAANFLPFHVLPKMVGKGISRAGGTVKDFINKSDVPEIKAPPPIPIPEDTFMKQYGSQDELPLTNSIEDIATNQNARTNQGDMFNDNQGAPAIPYDPTARIPSDAQAELPLTNSVQDVANQGSNPNGQLDMFGGAENQVSREPMSQIPEITPQVALRKAMDAEEAGKTAEVAFWKERAMELIREERAKENTPREPIHVNDVGTAADPKTMDALTRSTEGISYENVPPDGVIPRDAQRLPNGEPMLRVPRGNEWTKDENGIPVRQGLPESTVAPDYINRYMRQDEGSRNDLGNAIQEANGPKLGPDDSYGSSPLEAPSTPESTQLVNDLKSSNGIRRGAGPMGSQRGSIQLGTGDLAKAYRAIDKFILDAHAKFIAAGKYPLNKIVGALPEHVMRSMPGMKDALKDIIVNPPSGDQILADALKENITGKVWNNVQSGMALAGEKLHSTALVGAARWLQTAYNKTAYRDRTVVRPIEHALANLSSKDFNSLKDVLNEEMAIKKDRFTPQELAQKLTPRQVELYGKLRAALDTSLDETNATRKAAGLEPIDRNKAYAASMRNGDFGLPVYIKTADGGTKLAAFIQSETKAHANRALEHMKKVYGDKIDWDQTKIARKGDTSGIGVPRDVISGYTEMLKFLPEGDPLAHEIGASIEKLQEANGNKFQNHNQRFLDKHYVPGYEGDKPWLSESENAKAFMKAQMDYLRNSYAWNHMQEAVTNIKKLTGSPELAKAQPGVVKLIQAHLDRATGVSSNLVSSLENGIAGIIPSINYSRADGLHAGIGVSRRSLYRFTSSVKGATYLQQLSMSPGFMLATPLQGMLAIANHRLLSNQGNKHSAIKTLVNTVRDSGIAIAEDHLHAMTGAHAVLPGMSAIGREALNWGEDNNVFTKNVIDEAQTLRPQGAMNTLVNKVKPTIATPERINRITVFMSFAQHLTDSGMPKLEAFRKAAEFTGHSVTSMEAHDRPLIVNKLGVLGEMGYQYHSYLFNEYNQLSLLARHAAEGPGIRTGPLVAHMAGLMALGGVMALPGAKMVSDTWDKFKDSIARFKPDWYHYVQGIGMKGFMAQHSTDAVTASAVSGPLSQALGIDLSSRFDTSPLDVKHLFNQFATAPQEMMEWGALGKAAIQPTNRLNWEQALWAQSPPFARGMEETSLPDFTNGKDKHGNTLARRAGDINDPQTVVRRTPHDVDIRRLGLRSTNEARDMTINIANNEEQKRLVFAQKQLIGEMVRAVANKQEGASEYARKAMDLVPNANLITQALDQSVIDQKLTPSERDKLRVQNLAILRKVARIRNTENANH